MANYISKTTTNPGVDMGTLDKLGIGTTSPSAKLDVRDDGNALGVSHTSEQGGIILKAGYGYGTVIGHNLRTSNYCGICLRTSSTQTNGMYVHTDGKVGVGTTSPAAKLDVRGSAVFNDDGGDSDFRVEGDSEEHLLFCDASRNSVGIGTDSVVNAKLEVSSADDTAIMGRTSYVSGIGVYGTAEGSTGSTAIAVCGLAYLSNEISGKFRHNSSSGTALYVDKGRVRFSDLPTTDPAVAGVLWNDSGTLKVSAG